VGDIQIDSEMVKQLMDTGRFETMSHKVDEDEHSMEMHLPYIAHRMKGKDFTLVPILVGNLSVDSEIAYGKLLAPYLSDPRNFFIISSDFCHWGKRFRFQWYEKRHGAIWQSIEKLDRMGMDLIEKLVENLPFNQRENIRINLE